MHISSVIGILVSASRRVSPMPPTFLETSFAKRQLKLYMNAFAFEQLVSIFQAKSTVRGLQGLRTAAYSRARTKSLTLGAQDESPFGHCH